MPKPWQKKEKSDAKRFGGKVTPRSGGIWSSPGDVKTEDFLIDCKTTVHNSFSVTSAIWSKIRKESVKSGRLPLLSIQLGDGTEFVVMSKDDFEGFFE